VEKLVEYIRKQFPALNMTVNGNPAVFLDGPGGYQVPDCVIDAVNDYLINRNANVGGAFLTSRRTDEILQVVREAFGDFFNCSADEVAFGANMTSLSFSLSQALVREMRAGDRVLITRMDHDGNRSPWLELQDRGIVIEDVEVNTDTCTLDMQDFRAKLGDNTKVVACNYAQNAVGTISDVREIIDLAHEVGAVTVVDAVHYAAHRPIDVQAISTDFLICSAYKFFGPHVGILYGKKEVFRKLKTLRVRFQKPTPPHMIETGTLNHEGIAGAGAAVDFVAAIGEKFGNSPQVQKRIGHLQERRRHIAAGLLVFDAYEHQLVEHLIKGLESIPAITLYGPPADHPRTSTVSFTYNGHNAAGVAQYLAEKGLFVTHGDFYASSMIDCLGLRDQGGLVRIGIAPYNTREEMDRVIAALREGIY
jgi:cysteine desulfurase family protein (TIGR01976 family)